MAKPFEVSDDSFEEKVLDSEKPVLVDFTAEWCPPCKMIAPIIDEIADQYADKLAVVKLDTDYNPNTVQVYQVMGMPTVILFKDGQAIERITGYVPKERLLQKITPHLSM